MFSPIKKEKKEADALFSPTEEENKLLKEKKVNRSVSADKRSESVELSVTPVSDTEDGYNPLKDALAQEEYELRQAKKRREQEKDYNPLKLALEEETTGKPKNKLSALFTKKKKAARPATLNNKKPKRTKRRRINWLNVAIVLFLVCGLVGGVGSYYFIAQALSTAETFDPTRVVTKNSTQLFDRNGECFANNLGKETRQNISYEDLPQCVIDAFIAVEDSRFFIHNGFDLPRFVKAAVENLKTLSFGQGGSTFTMQMVKNSYFMIEGTGGAAKSIERKIQEIAMAMDADESLSKEDIFTYYINRINFGANGRGIQVSSQYFFNKDVTELGLSEAAMLAGIVNAPYGWNPFWNLDKATTRRNEVLNLMERHGYITTFECQAAKKIKVEDLLVHDQLLLKYDAIPNQAFIDTVIEEVIALTGDNPYEVPMRIYTTLDPALQRIVEDIQNGQYPAAKVNAHKYMDTAVVVIDKNGEILAIGGGKNYNVQRGFNFVTDMRKQPGSATKPFLSYALAYEHLGLTTESYVFDGPMNFPGSNTRVVDYNNKYRGIINVQTALSDSRNVPAVDLLYQSMKAIGSENIVKYLNTIGFKQVSIDNFSVMHAIGGGDFLTNPLEISGAYNMLMNRGEYIQPHCVYRIEYDDGSRPVDTDYPRVRALSEEAAWLVTDVLRKNVGTGPPAAGQYGIIRKQYPVFAKSGTTDWGGAASKRLKLPVPNGSKDKQLICATTEYVIAVWVGFDKGVPGENTYYSVALSTAQIPANIIKIVQDHMDKNYPRPGSIPRPKGIGSVTFISGYLEHFAPYPGMDSNFLVTGLNKAGTTELQTFIPPVIGEIYIVDAGIADTNAGTTTFRVTVPTFYLPEYLEVAPLLKEFPLGSKTYPGGRGNHVTWWMGPVRYYAYVESLANIPISSTILSEGNTIYVDVDNSKISGGQVRVCSYYAFSNLTDIRSNTACQIITIP